MQFIMSQEDSKYGTSRRRIRYVMSKYYMACHAEEFATWHHVLNLNLCLMMSQVEHGSGSISENLESGIKDYGDIILMLINYGKFYKYFGRIASDSGSLYI